MILKSILVFSALLISQNLFALEVGDKAPCGVLKHVYTDGSEHQDDVCAPLKAGQLVMIEFSASTCGYCVRNLPKLATISRELSDKTTTRLVLIDRDETRAREFMKAYAENIIFPVGLDTTRAVYKAFGNIGTPTMFIVNSDHTIVFKHIGEMEEEDMNNVRKFVRGE